ncbi:unnamed protein product [marine sediment metagenome]|uniref:Uncharacterized protein n=1 Tax=marine sediment metagenome TaxID=412755 RepID=X1C6N1_9ZZZZ
MNAFSHRVEENRRTGEVSEAEKQAFLKEKTFKCIRLDIRITDFSCKMIQRQAGIPDKSHPAQKCKGCFMFKAKQEELEKKTCKLHIEYPGLCGGEGTFKRWDGQRSRLWVEKVFCCHECGVTYGRIRNNGWSKKQIPKSYYKTKK